MHCLHGRLVALLAGLCRIGLCRPLLLGLCLATATANVGCAVPLESHLGACFEWV